MSYISLPRIVFSGRFQADVSTVNNDVRHYSNQDFESRFQLPQQPGSLIGNGWWNPEGSGAFRLIDVQVNQAFLSPQADASDKAVGLSVNAQVSRSSAVLVDLDPQMQNVSTLFGLRLQLTDGKNAFFTGDFRPTAFRDMPLRGAFPSAKFTSVLTDVVWTDAAATSPVLAALRAGAEANGDSLAVNFMTYGFFRAGRFMGFLSGSIGLWRSGEPKSFFAGRRFAPADGNGSAQGINYFDADIDNGQLSVDLGNALPLVAGGVSDIGRIFVAVLQQPDGVGASGLLPGTAEAATIATADALVLGEVKYQETNWLNETAGIVDFALDPVAASLAADHPLALLALLPSGQYQVLIRETVAGLCCRAEDFVVRLDSTTTGTVDWQVKVFARRFGKPLANLPMGLFAYPRMSGRGIGDPTDPSQPVAPIPDINFPAECVVTSAPATSDGNGAWTISFRAKNPAAPRGYLDGQLFQYQYGITTVGVSAPHQLDFIVLHLRDAVTVPAQPDWASDVVPFMQQYDNLYPVMSKRLFSLADPKLAEANARLLSFAFTRPFDDPNHMPVTRDLSAGKRAIVLNWLAQFSQDPVALVEMVAPLGVPPPVEAFGEPPARYTPPLPSLAEIDAALDQLGTGTDGKTQAMRSSLLTRRALKIAQTGGQ